MRVGTESASGPIDACLLSEPGPSGLIFITGETGRRAGAEDPEALSQSVRRPANCAFPRENCNSCHAIPGDAGKAPMKLLKAEIDG